MVGCLLLPAEAMELHDLDLLILRVLVQIQLDDLRGLLNATADRKGKGRAGDVSDASVATSNYSHICRIFVEGCGKTERNLGSELAEARVRRVWREAVLHHRPPPVPPRLLPFVPGHLLLDVD